MSWAAQQNITLRFIQPGKPQQNAYIERHNRTVRYDWLGQRLFNSLGELQGYTTQWQWFYNHEHRFYQMYSLSNKTLFRCINRAVWS